MMMMYLISSLLFALPSFAHSLTLSLLSSFCLLLLKAGQALLPDIQAKCDKGVDATCTAELDKFNKVLEGALTAATNAAGDCIGAGTCCSKHSTARVSCSSLLLPFLFFSSSPPASLHSLINLH
jgi:hypothetical protein